MQRIFLAAAIVLAASGTARAAGPHQVRYVGIHPIPKVEGTGLCYIEVPHVHVYAVAPADKVQYRDYQGSNFFVGDPVAYGYDGPKVAYKGHHPVQVDAVVAADVEVAAEPAVVFCYLDGPHYHAFAPVEGPDFKLAGGAYFYVGTPPPVYVEARPAMVEINAIYTPLVYARPVVVVAAPVGWIGARVDVVAPAAVVAPRVEVRAPSVRVGVGVGVGIGVGIGAGVGVGGGVAVGGGGPVIIRGGHKHKKAKRLKWKH
jgi:hypothetical protein